MKIVTYLMTVLIVGIVFATVLGCTFAMFNSTVKTKEKDSHDATSGGSGGTNRGGAAHTFDVNLSPR